MQHLKSTHHPIVRATTVAFLLACAAARAATFTVTTTNDSGPGSLREAISAANASAEVDLITFNIPGAGIQTITPDSPLPTLTEPVAIDGYTQPGSSANTLADGDNAVLMIELDGSSVGAGGEGLVLTAPNCTVRGLAIHGFFRGIDVAAGDSELIAGNFIGLDASGTKVTRFFNDAVILRAPNCRVGGPNPADRNLIAGGDNGINILAPGATVLGNFIGTDRTGAKELGNASSGVFVQADTATIGGPAAGARNVISGNNGDGITIGNVTLAVVQGNFIGTDATGTKAVGNGVFGVSVSGQGNTVGGASVADRNLVSGNGNTGLLLSGSGHVVQGNFVGVDVTGANVLPNGNGGINLGVGTPTGIRVGGLTAAPGTPPGNVISGNSGVGLNFFGAQRNTVEGNIIGADVTGTRALGNSLDGVRIVGSGNVIGGTNAGAANLIVFNGSDAVSQGSGIIVPNDSGSTNNAFLGNSIFGNSRLGIDLLAPAEAVGTPTSNDSDDADTGANNLQNFPVIAVAAITGSGATVVGSLNSAANSLFRVEFFANPSCDVSGNGEGRQFLGFTNVTTDATGNASFAVTFSGVTPVGPIITATATDANNNTSEFSACSTACTITCPSNITVTNDAGLCGTVVNYSGPETSGVGGGICGGMNSVPASGSFFPVGTTLVTCSNSIGALCTFTVTVADTQPPTILCPNNIVVSTDPGQCSRSNVTFTASASDNCPGVTVVSTPPSGSTFAKGTNTVIIVATDASGNTNACSFLVTVLDSEPPRIFCPIIEFPVILATDPGQCSKSNVNYSSFLPTGATDNCGPVTLVTTPPSGSTLPTGTHEIVTVGTDSSGNTSSCSFLLIIRDSEPPTITCPANIINTAAVGASNAVVLFPEPSVTDNCPGATAACSPPSGSSFPIGTNAVTCTATDVSGNTNICTFTVIVNASAPPGSLIAQSASGVTTNRQTGLLEQTVRLCNVGGTTVVNAQRVLVGGISATTLYNRAGTNGDGTPYVLHNPSLPAGACVDLLLEYYVPTLRPPTNITLVAEEVLPAVPAIPADAQQISLVTGRDPIQLSNGRFLIEFVTKSNCTYYIQYSASATSGFKTAIPAITANGNRIQWLDDGPPKTDSKPGIVGQRFYRVFESCP